MSATLPSAANDSSAERDARVDAAIAEFLLAVDAGCPPALPEFLARHADIARELREEDRHIRRASRIEHSASRHDHRIQRAANLLSRIEPILRQVNDDHRRPNTKPRSPGPTTLQIPFAQSLQVRQ